MSCWLTERGRRFFWRLSSLTKKSSHSILSTQTNWPLTLDLGFWIIFAGFNSNALSLAAYWNFRLFTSLSSFCNFKSSFAKTPSKTATNRKTVRTFIMQLQWTNDLRLLWTKWVARNNANKTNCSSSALTNGHIIDVLMFVCANGQTPRQKKSKVACYFYWKQDKDLINKCETSLRLSLGNGFFWRGRYHNLKKKVG